MSHENRNSQLDFHRDPDYQERVRIRLNEIKRQRSNSISEDVEPNRGILSGIGEMGGRQARAAVVGVIAAAALIGGAQKIAERTSDILNTHNVTKTHTEHGVQNPYDSYSHITTKTTYTQQEIGQK